MTALDYLVLLASMLGIAAYGIWRARRRHTLDTYLKGAGDARWLVIGLSVMATQASAVTFLSTPGQGYSGGLSFIQNYFGAPFALILISAVFLPIYRRLKVYTAYEYLGQRFDTKTRLLAASLFLLQRGLGAGLTLYAPAIVLSAVLGWRLDLTILAAGVLVIAYTAVGGSDAVTHTQKLQLTVSMAGLIAAFVVLWMKLPPGVGLSDALSVAGVFDKLHAVDFSPSPRPRYTFWSGLLGGAFLALSYFGTDQSQVGRYIGAASLKESRLGLMFNAVCKIPMQFFILLLGVLLFAFYQFSSPPVLFNRPAWDAALKTDAATLRPIEQKFHAVHAEQEQLLRQWLAARQSGDAAGQSEFRAAAVAAAARAEALRAQALKAMPDVRSNENDYVFITFILDHLPHGVIGLLIASFFAATLSSKSAELTALASTTTVDLYRHLARTDATDEHYVRASRLFTLGWGAFALVAALCANLAAENLIQATNILGSIFYGVILGVFATAFFLPRIAGTAVFVAALAAQALVFALFFSIDISYLWYNVIGCAACVAFGMVLQPLLGPRPQTQGSPVTVSDADRADLP